jgi:hypothetical protein
MTELQKWQAVNQCENGKALHDLIIQFADEEGMIHGRERKFDATQMANHVHDVLQNGYPSNLLTREFGIRQQAIYLKTFNK